MTPWVMEPAISKIIFRLFSYHITVNHDHNVYWWRGQALGTKHHIHMEDDSSKGNYKRINVLLTKHSVKPDILNAIYLLLALNARKMMHPLSSLIVIYFWSYCMCNDFITCGIVQTHLIHMILKKRVARKDRNSRIPLGFNCWILNDEIRCQSKF